MATKTVQWVSTTRLSCFACIPSNVKIWTRFNKVISGQLLNSVRVPNQCGGPMVYRYTLSYDTLDIPVETSITSLTCGDILGVACEGVLTAYIDQAKEDVIAEAALDFRAYPKAAE